MSNSDGDFTVRRFTIIFCCLLNVVGSRLHAQRLGLHTNVKGYEFGTTITAGLYKSYVSSYLCLRKLAATPIFHPKNEHALYSWLLLRTLAPRYIVLQGTLYPTATLSSYLETFHPKTYQRFEWKGWNCLHSLSGETEEPGAVSLLVGNVAYLGYRETLADGRKRLRQSGSGMAGLLFSGGQFHILDNIRINDWWWQAELVMTGLLNEKNVRKIQWNFRLGIKNHSNMFVQDVMMLSVFRDQTDWRVRHWSFSKNAVFRYEMFMPLRRDFRQGRFFSRQMLLYGKKFPFVLWNRRMAVRLAGGMLAEIIRSYNHEQRRFQPGRELRIIYLIQPGVEF